MTDPLIDRWSVHALDDDAPPVCTQETAGLQHRVVDFQRARSEEQRKHRRRVILRTTAAMLAEMPVAGVSLNELSRRVGLAKSNVLRYFESREAILLELLDAELHDWAAEIDGALVPGSGSVPERATGVADTLALSIAARPVMCDLVSAQSAVLERNISTDSALRHKHAIAAEVGIVVDAVVRALPELTSEQAYQVIAYTLLMTAGSWPQSTPSPALQAAYGADPETAATQMDFTEVLRDLIDLTVTGMLARGAASGLTA